MLCISRRASLLAVGLLNLIVCCVGLASCTSWFILRDNLRTVGDGLTWLLQWVMMILFHRWVASNGG